MVIEILFIVWAMGIVLTYFHVYAYILCLKCYHTSFYSILVRMSP
jgi:hypothetical protein